MPKPKESGEDRVERETALQRHGVEPPSKACGKLMRGIYDALTTCARPAGHRGKHRPIYDPRERPE